MSDNGYGVKKSKHGKSNRADISVKSFKVKMPHPTYVGFLVSRMEEVVEPKEETSDAIDLSKVMIKEEIFQNEYGDDDFQDIVYNGPLNTEKQKQISMNKDSVQVLPNSLISVDTTLADIEMHSELKKCKRIRKRINVKCPICLKEYCKRYIKIHIQTHSKTDKPQSKKTQCEICNRTICKTALPGHLLIHSGEKPFICSICGLQFRKSHQLKDHENRHTDFRAHQCGVCHKTFKRKRYLAIHANLHTGEKQYTCKVCEKKFTFKAGLYVHLKVHNNDKPHVCNVCGQACITKNNLRDHMVKHTRERNYECAACGLKFGRPHNLKTHVTRYCRGEPKTDVMKGSNPTNEL